MQRGAVSFLQGLSPHVSVCEELRTILMLWLGAGAGVCFADRWRFKPPQVIGDSCCS